MSDIFMSHKSFPESEFQLLNIKKDYTIVQAY